MKEYKIEISRSQRNLDMDLPGNLVFGIPGKDGVGISSIVNNDDYTITFVLSDGSRYTTPSIRGEAGRGIVSVERTDGNGAAGTYDTYTITYTDNTTSNFKVYNGANCTGVGSAEGAVLYTVQELTEEQKEQARKNIGATAIKVSIKDGVLSIE